MNRRGPAINSAGELIGMISGVKFAHSTMHVALIVPVEKIRDFVGPYLPAEKK